MGHLPLPSISSGSSGSNPCLTNILCSLSRCRKCNAILLNFWLFVNHFVRYFNGLTPLDTTPEVAWGGRPRVQRKYFFTRELWPTGQGKARLRRKVSSLEFWRWKCRGGPRVIFPY